MITQAIENKILTKLERIENLLFELVPKIEKRKMDMGEDDVLRLIENGNEEYRKNQTMNFDDFINNQCPHLAKK